MVPRPFLYLALGALLCSGWTTPLTAVEGSDSSTPLRPWSDAHGDLQGLWRALAGGDERALLDIDARLFREPIAQGRDDSPLLERWTRSLARNLQRAGSPQPVLRALDLVLQRELDRFRGAADSEAAIASHFLPGPRAVAVISAAADRAFDRGDFSTYLHIHRFLSEVAEHRLDATAEHARRLQLARADVRQDPTLEWWQPLPIPGPVTAIDNPDDWLAISADSGPWLVEEGLLMALDPFAQVLWQRPLERRARVWTSPRHALVHAPSGVLLIDAVGQEQRLTMPSTIRPLAVVGDWAWLHDDGVIYRLDMASGSYQRLTLPAAPIGPPLVRGSHSLWLTADECILVNDTSVQARYVHGLGVGPGWQFSQARSAAERQRVAVLITSPEGQRWRLQPFPENAHQLLRPMHLHRALRHHEALAAWEALDDEQRRQTADALAIALSALGPDAGWDSERALTWIDEPQWRLRSIVALAGTAPGPELAAVIRAAAAKTPDTLIPVDPGLSPLHPSHSWPHTLSGKALAKALDAAPTLLPEHLEDLLARGQAPVSSAVSAGAGPRERHWESRRQPGQMSTQFIDGDRLHLSFENRWTQLTRFHGEGDSRLAWRQRWATPASLPGRSVDLRDDHLIVAEGQSRLIVIDPDLGTLRGRYRVPNGLAMPSQSHVLSGRGIAVLHPISVNTQLSIIDDQHHSERIVLPGPARWSLALGSHLLIAFGDDSLKAYPGSISIPWPGPLPQQTPRIGADGLYDDSGNRWPWAEK